jgi:predicted nucleic acid-binding protein
VILVDTSVWIDHLRAGDSRLVALLRDGQVLAHPWVTGELALGHLSRRGEIIALHRNLPQATVATDIEVLTLIDNLQLYGVGIGYVDAHLLAATRLTPGTRLWTRDKRLAAVASQQRLGAGGDDEQEPATAE